MILCLGDSLTRGYVGYSYVRFLSRKDIKNCGKNGDTTYGTLNRLIKYQNKKWFDDVDICVINIGTNDILQPFLCGYSPLWRLIFMSRAKSKKWADAAEFEKLLRQMIELLLKNGKRAILTGLSVIQLKNYPLDKLHERNEIVRRLAEEYAVPFVDLITVQEIACPGFKRDYKWGHTGIPRAVDIILMLLLPFTKTLLSQFRKLELTVDGVHHNMFTAKLLAKKTDRAIKRLMREEM